MFCCWGWIFSSWTAESGWCLCQGIAHSFSIYRAVKLDEDARCYESSPQSNTGGAQPMP